MGYAVVLFATAPAAGALAPVDDGPSTDVRPSRTPSKEDGQPVQVDDP